MDALAHAVRAAAGVADDARLAAHTNTTPSSHEVLRALSNALAADLAHLSARLRRQLSAGFQAALGAAGWPPPFLSAGDEAGGAWRGLDSPDVRGAALQLTLLQRSAGEAAQNEGPWVAQELAAGVGAALRRHFASSSAPTDRADRPEWLLAITLRAARVCCAAAYQLQGVLAACFGGDGDDARCVHYRGGIIVSNARALVGAGLGKRPTPSSVPTPTHHPPAFPKPQPGPHAGRGGGPRHPGLCAGPGADWARSASPGLAGRALPLAAPGGRAGQLPGEVRCSKAR